MRNIRRPLTKAQSPFLDPVHVVSGIRDNPPPRENFTECLYGLVLSHSFFLNLKMLTTLQKRAIRVVSRSGCDAHTDPTFKELKMNSIHLLYLNQFMFSFITGNLNWVLFFSVNNNVHSYNTRHASLFFRLPLCRTNIRQFSISFQGAEFFNTLSSDIKHTTSQQAERFFNSQLSTSCLPFFYFLFHPTLVSHLTERLAVYMCFFPILSVLGRNLTLYKPAGIF